MPALKAQVEKLDDVPESYRPLYAEKDGAFVLEVEGALDVFAPALVANNKKLVKEKQTVAQKLAELEQKYEGIDLEEIERLRQAAAQGDPDDKSKDKHVAALEQQTKQWDKERDKYKGGIEELTKANGALTHEIESLMVTNVTLKAIEELDGIPDMLLPAIVLAGKVKAVMEDGKRVVRIVDSEGVVAVGDSKGTPMSVKQYVETEFKGKPAWGGAFKPSGAGGSGATNGTHRRLSGVDLTKLTPAERMKAFRRAGG